MTKWLFKKLISHLVIDQLEKSKSLNKNHWLVSHKIPRALKIPPTDAIPQGLLS
jgi:hypothetical protein